MASRSVTGSLHASASHALIFRTACGARAEVECTIAAAPLRDTMWRDRPRLESSSAHLPLEMSDAESLSLASAVGLC